MEFIRKHKTLSTIVLLFLVIFLLVGVTYGRYIKNIIDEYILETKAFYFNSSILTVNGKNLSISNWDGVNSYTLTIDLNNRKSATKYTTTDIEYNISVNCPDTVVCTLNKTSGILRSTDTNDTYQIVVTPQRNFYEGDTVRVQTSVSSTIPYQKTMSATYTIGVQSSDFSYNIEDSVNSKYLNLNFVNSVSYYEVEEAFSNYAVGDLISLSDYQALSASDKAKCFSAKVTVEFDVNTVNNLAIQIGETTNVFNQRLSSLGANDGSHIKIVYDGTTVTPFVDGVEKTSYKVDFIFTTQYYFNIYNSGAFSNFIVYSV